MEVYLDESGYTGEDLMNAAQPVFVLASTILAQDVCKEIFDECFAGLQASELKHSLLGSRPRGREKIVRFVHTVKQHRSSLTTDTVHKQFALLTLLIDCWVEPAMHRDGIDLYDRGGNIGLANLSYCTLASLMPDFPEHLKRFQIMMRKRTRESYDHFWGSLYAAYRRSEEVVSDILIFFLGGEMRLGFEYLVDYPKGSLDLALSSAFKTVAYWRKKTEASFLLIHDQSSNMSRQRWIWDAIVSPDVPAAKVGYDRRKVQFPLNVEKTLFAASEDYLQLQFVDLLAGATAFFCRSKVLNGIRSPYADALEEAGILDFSIGAIWPSMEVEPEELGTVGENAGDLAGFLADLLPSIERKWNR